MSGPFDPMSYPARWVQQLRSALPGMALPPMPPQKASPFPPAPPPAPIRRRSKLHIPQSSLVPPDQRRVIVFVSLEHVMHHEIVRVAGLTSHHVRLVNNGELHYAYNAHGELGRTHRQERRRMGLRYSSDHGGTAADALAAPGECQDVPLTKQKADLPFENASKPTAFGMTRGEC